MRVPHCPSRWSNHALPQPPTALLLPLLPLIQMPSWTRLLKVEYARPERVLLRVSGLASAPATTWMFPPQWATRSVCAWEVAVDAVAVVLLATVLVSLAAVDVGAALGRALKGEW